jgi:hypothetical protein
MKKFIVLIFIITLTFANHIKWQGSYAKALERAKIENKSLMVLLIKSNCKECQRVVKDIFSNKEYVDELNSKFISVIINFDSRVSYPIEMYYSNDFPTLFFVNSKSETFIKKPIYRDITEQKIKEFLKNFDSNQ